MEKEIFPRCRICGREMADGERSHRFCKLCGMGITDKSKEFCCRECRKRWCAWKKWK
ncbi:Uncharacterised protein [Candidatus Norongarragalina meridionalis]|nr:Uncharacterised protein [Candidatus Norongarragalina meridionalis]